MARPQRQFQKKVLILHTGGTIGMEIGNPPKPDRPLAPDHGFVRALRRTVPELWRLAQVEVEIRTFSNKDSSELIPNDWQKIAGAIAEFTDDYDAFVITHGTDTMVYTGTALSFLLPYPCKPVVLTGSQRPLKEIRTDARRNLINSVALAATQRICEVSLFFDTVLLRANRARKIHIEEFHAFASPNFPILAEDRLRTRFFKPHRKPLNRPRLNPIFDSRIQVVKAFPGAHVGLVPGTRAVLVEAFGCGNLPMTDSSVLAFLKACARKKVPVVVTSQVPAGAVTPEIYDMGRRALELGAISTRDMTFEAALIKCMLLAGNEVAYENWAAGIQSNWAGEIAMTV